MNDESNNPSNCSRTEISVGRVLSLLFILSVVVNFWSDEQIDDPSLQVTSSTQVKHDTPKKHGLPTNFEHDKHQRFSPNGKNRNSICSIVPDLRTSSARYTWIQHVQKIHASSRLEDDLQYLRHDFTAKLLALATPRLDHSIKTMTKDWQLVSRILDKAYQRYKYLIDRQNQKRGDAFQQNDNYTDTENEEEEPPPIRIMVLGGSVAVGIQCRTGIQEHKYDDSNTRYCAWPHRLENLINHFFGVGKLVEVQNEAVGGTQTDIGSSILKYDLIHGVLESDILIHAFATNDVQHVSSRNLHDFMLSLQEFCRLAFAPPREKLCRIRERANGPHQSRTSATQGHRRHFHYPLLIHVNDAIGHYNSPIAKYARMPQAVQSLANYYGFVSLSYVDMVRDVVYGDPKETWFSSNEFLDGMTYVPNVHPGQGMHIVVSWIIAYCLLQISTTYCTLSYDFWGIGDGLTGDGESEDDWVPDNGFSYMTFDDYDNTVLSETIPLFNNGTDEENEGVMPRLPPTGLLPSIDSEVTMSELNARWRTGSKDMQMAQKRPCPRDGTNNDSNDPTCPFSWVSGHDQSKDMAWIEDHVVSRLTPFNNWTLDLHFNFRKMGLSPSLGNVGSSMSIEFDLHSLFHGGPIRRVVLFYLKSYGATWKDSKARIEVFESSTDDKHRVLLNSTDLAGYHSRRTSEMHLMELAMSERLINEGRTLVVQATLVEGQTFKIMGLALCR